MLFQKDYILRMIEMMGDLMHKVRELMDELSQMKLLDNLCRRHCGIPLETLEALDAQSLKELLAPTPRLFASELLYTHAKSIRVPDEYVDELLVKSLRLLASLFDEGRLCELRTLRLKELKTSVLHLLSADDLMNCAEFLYQGEEYADMEDAIFQALEMSEVCERVRYITRGETLLRASATASDRALALARTSSHELRQSAIELTYKLHMM